MRFMHAPQHVGEHIAHNLASVANIRPRSVGFTEMDPGKGSTVGMIRGSLPGYRICTDDKGGLGPHSQEVPIAVRVGPFCKVIEVRVAPLSPKVGATGWGNDRWATIVQFKRLGVKYAHVALHLNAAIQDQHDGHMFDNDRRWATETAVKMVDGHITTLDADGYRVVVTGDWNWRDHGVDWDFSPLAVADRHGMGSFSDGLDWILWSKRLKLVGDVQVIPRDTTVNKSDHPWLIASLRRRGGGK